MNTAHPVLTCTTDFGVVDGYVARMRGAYRKHGGRYEWIDVTHSIQPGNLLAGAYRLRTLVNQFPQQSLHLAVVDPGVGTERKILVAKAASDYWIAPDNGLLSFVLQSQTVESIFAVKAQTIQPSASQTFHGRDIFAPIAAKLSLGVPPSQFGTLTEQFETLSTMPRQTVPREGDPCVVLDVDHFGNLTLDCHRSLAPTHSLKPLLQDFPALQFYPTYGMAPKDLPFLLWNSADFLEIAIPGGSAAKILGLQPGDALVWETQPS